MSDQALEETLNQVAEQQPPEQEPASLTETVSDKPAPTEETTPDKQVSRESASDKNFRELRSKVARMERDEEIRAQQLAAQHQKNAQDKLQEEEPDDIDIGDDDLAEGKHLRKQSKEIRKMKKEMEQYKQQMYEQTTEARIKSLYPDFDKVVSSDSVKLLSEQYPELAQTINTSPDLYNKAASAYTLIKKFGLYKEDTYQNDRLQATLNAAKPKSSAAVSPQQGESPMSNANAFANGLTDDLKSKLYREMIDAKKRI